MYNTYIHIYIYIYMYIYTYLYTPRNINVDEVKSGSGSACNIGTANFHTQNSQTKNL